MAYLSLVGDLRPFRPGPQSPHLSASSVDSSWTKKISMGPLPCYHSLKFTITHSKAMGFTDHISLSGYSLVTHYTLNRVRITINSSFGSGIFVYEKSRVTASAYRNLRELNIKRKNRLFFFLAFFFIL